MAEVSVIVPIYNTSKEYIQCCVDSVAAQEWTDWELILVDDGSTPHTAQYIDTLAVSEERITVLHKPNGGLSSARNAGIDAAGGKYLVFLDSDDFLEPDFLKVMCGKAEELGLDMVVSPTRNVAADGTFAEDLPVDAYYRTFSGQKRLIRYNVTPRMYRREFLDAHGLRFCEGELMEDVVFCLEANLLTDRWKLLDYHGYCYRLNPDGIVGSFRKKGIADTAIPYRGLEAAVRRLTRRGQISALNTKVLEYCTVRILITILFDFCRKSDVSTVVKMCRYTGWLLTKYFPRFTDNPYFNVWGEEHIPRYQCVAAALFKLLYRTHLLKPFAVVYTRF